MDADLTIAVLTLSDNAMALLDLLIEKEIITLDEFNAKLEEVHKVTGNIENIEKIEMAEKINNIVKKDDITAEERLYVSTNAPKIFSGEQLDLIIKAVYIDKK